MANARNYEEYRRQVLDELGIEYVTEDITDFRRWRLKVLQGLADLITYANMSECVAKWLDDHPEATTTVEDGSITYEKLNDSLKAFLTPQMFGAVGDGVHDDTEAIQSAIQACEILNEGTETGAKGGTVFVPSGKYLITKSIKFTKHGTQFYGEGRHATQFIANSAITVIENSNKASYIQRLYLHDFSINLNGYEGTGIDFTSIGQSIIERVAVYGSDSIENKVGTGYHLASIKSPYGNFNVAGHLNTLFNCIGQHLNTAVIIEGGSNANNIITGEYHQCVTAIKLYHGNNSIDYGNSNVIENCRIENCDVGIDNGLHYTKAISNYFDALTKAMVIAENGIFLNAIANYYSNSTVGTVIDNPYTSNRTYAITRVENAFIKTELLEFANGNAIRGLAGSNLLELIGNLNAINSTIDIGRLAPKAISMAYPQSTAPSGRNVLWRNSDNDLVYTDKDGNVKKIAFE